MWTEPELPLPESIVCRKERKLKTSRPAISSGMIVVQSGSGTSITENNVNPNPVTTKWSESQLLPMPMCSTYLQYRSLTTPDRNQSPSWSSTDGTCTALSDTNIDLVKLTMT